MLIPKVVKDYRDINAVICPKNLFLTILKDVYRVAYGRGHLRGMKSLKTVHKN